MDFISSGSSSEESVSSTTSLSSRTSSLSSFALPEIGKSTPEKPLQVLKVLLDVLHRNHIPGPNLIRLEKEFNLVTGEGGEGKVFEAPKDFQEKLASISVNSKKPRLRKSARFWQKCVIKRLRSDASRGLAFQVNSAHTEIRLLSMRSLRSHPNVIKLLGWALCLDSLEDSASSIPRLPLLILEKAKFDLRRFLVSTDYDSTLHSDLCNICLGIGRGLEALHRESISHGDIKPANVLIHDQWVSEHDVWSSTPRWLPKLCDFGLAVTLKEDGGRSKPRKYLGTGGWKPPECYLDSPPASHQMCDIFAYGLVSWCVFIGNPSSPISTKMNQDEESATIREQLGEQIFYHKASQSIRGVYGLFESDIHLALYEVTSRAVNFGSRAIKKQLFSRRRRKAFLEGPRDLRTKQSNRILMLLRGALNDSPQSRHPRPWEYMDFSLHESIPLVQDPAKYSAMPDSTVTQEKMHSLSSVNNAVLSQSSQKNRLITQKFRHRFRQAMKRTTRTMISFIIARLPWLMPQSPLQQVYDEIFFEVNLSLRDQQALQEDRDHGRIFSFKPNDIGLFDHEEGDRCHSLNRLYYKLYRAIQDAANDAKIQFDRISSLSDSEIDSIRAVFDRWQYSEYNLTVYSFARLRSRIKKCCWQEYCRNPNPLFNPIDGPALDAMLEETSMMVMLSTFNFDTLTWFCRGQMAPSVFIALDNEPEKLWNWLHKHDLDPRDKTERMTLFLERGCNIGQELHSNGVTRSVFQLYLESFVSGELAVTVCRQFRRHASRDGATLWEQFYLTGQSPDRRDDEPIDERDLVRTALHDAVRASSYSVVEYLVRTNFNVGVKDALGKSALDVAEEIGASVAKVGTKKHHIQNNQIIALLRQTKSPLDRLSRLGFQPTLETLPLGWEATDLGAGTTVYQETSIESEADPLTFIKPSEGLLENRKIALGQRKITGQGQVYYLDPLRFLHTKIKGSERAESAAEATYGEDWYEKKAQEIRAAHDIRAVPLDPYSDQRLWYRLLMTAYYVLEYVATRVAILIGFVSPSIYVIALVCFVVLILYDAWT